MAFSDLGLTEQEFFSLPPFRTYLMQMHHVRKIERQWEQTRDISVMIHNMAGKVSDRTMTRQEYRKLSFDKDIELPQWTQEEAQELIDKWPDIKKN